MDSKSPPSIATIYNYREPIDRTLTVLLELKKRSKEAQPSRRLDQTGWYVLAIALFETMMSDLLLFHLTENPHLLPKENRQFSTEEVIAANDGSKLLKSSVEKYIQSIMYKRVDEILPIFSQKLMIEQIADSETINRLTEIKDKRNIVLHVDPLGLQNAQTWVSESCDFLATLTQTIGDRVEVRFGGLTRVAAMRSLWEYVFVTPIMPFEAFNSIDEVADMIRPKIVDLEHLGISNSERIYLEIWRCHFGGGNSITSFHIRSLTGDKLFWLLNKLKQTGWQGRLEH